MSNPTTLVEQFDGSLGEFTGVDPIRFDDGLRLEQAGTNLIANPTAVTNLTGWTPGSANVSIQRVTSLPAPLPGTLAGLVTTGFRMHATANDASFAQVATPLTLTAVPHAFGVLVYIPTSYTGAIPRLRQRNFTSATGDDFAAANPSLRDQWQLLDVTFTPAGGDLSGDFWVQIGGTINSGDEFWFACAQAEVGSYASSFILSSLGDGHSASPSPHSRAASSASISPSGILSPASGAIAARITPTIETGLEEIWGECGTKGSGTDHVRWGRDASKHPFVEWSSNDAAYQRLTASETVSAGEQKDLVLNHSGTGQSLSVDAGMLQSASRAAVSASWGAGDLKLEATAGGVIVAPFATFDRPLTALEIATLNSKQNWTMGTLSGRSLIATQFQLRPY